MFTLMVCGYNHEERGLDGSKIGEVIRDNKSIIEAIRSCPFANDGNNILCAHPAAFGMNGFDNYIFSTIGILESDEEREEKKRIFKTLLQASSQLDQLRRISLGGISQIESPELDGLGETYTDIVSQAKKIVKDNGYSFTHQMGQTRKAPLQDQKEEFYRLIMAAQNIIKEEYLKFLPTIGIEVKSNWHSYDNSKN